MLLKFWATTEGKRNSEYFFSPDSNSPRHTNSAKSEGRVFALPASVRLLTMLHAAGGHARSLARVLAPRRLVRFRRAPCSPVAAAASSLPLTSTTLRLGTVPPSSSSSSSSRRQYSPTIASRSSSKVTAAAAAPATDARPASRELARAAQPLTESARGPKQTPPLTLYDSMARAKRAFEPRLGGEPVSMYVCGVTVYDFSHVGKLFGELELG